MSTSRIAAADSGRRIVELFPIPTRHTFPPLHGKVGVSRKVAPCWVAAGARTGYTPGAPPAWYSRSRSSRSQHRAAPRVQLAGAQPFLLACRSVRRELHRVPGRINA